MLTNIDPKLAPLLAQYIRGVDGAEEVFHDALLERGVAPLDFLHDDTPNDRLDKALVLVTPKVQTQIGCACARLALSLPRFASDLGREPAPAKALSTLEQDAPDTQEVLGMRQEVFSTWARCRKNHYSNDATRVVWAIWMLLREMPLVALRTLRTIEGSAVEAQIDLAARALGG